MKVLGSGSRGNATLLWVGDSVVLIDAGLPIRDLSERLASAGVGHKGLDHILVSHGHLDHARSAGILAKRHGAALHCPAKIQHHRAVARAPVKHELCELAPSELALRDGSTLRVTSVKVPHDCDPTFAFRMEWQGRTLVYLTDMGEPREDVASALEGADVLLIEANHDVAQLTGGPYPAALKARVLGNGGHLSNDQMATMLARLAHPGLHSVVLLHLSEKNNRPSAARSAAESAVARADRRVDVHVATQAEALGVLDV